MILASNWTDLWVQLLINIPPAGVFGFILWWVFARTIPALQAAHERQELTQRSDLLGLLQKEKDLAEKVIQIFAGSQQITVKDNHQAIRELQTRADLIKQTALEILEALKSSTVIGDEQARIRTRLAELEKKHGSDWTRPRKQTRTKTDDETPNP